MRRILATLISVAAAVTLAACGSSSSSAATSPKGAMSSQASTTDHSQVDVTFAQQMIAHHAQAIQMADLAVDRAATPKVKDLAAKIKAAQAPEIQLMSSWLTGWGQPTAMPTDNAMPGMDMSSPMPGAMSDADMSKLQASRGAEFDRQFLTFMISHHQGAIEMAKGEQSNGTFGPAKALASNIESSQSTEIATMQLLLKTAS